MPNNRYKGIRTDTKRNILKPEYYRKNIIDDTDHGTLTLNQDGSSTYVPDADFTGTDTFTYKIEDAEIVGKKYYTYDEFGKETQSGALTLRNFSTYTGAVDEGGNIYNMDTRFYNANTGGLHGRAANTKCL